MKHSLVLLWNMSD